MSTPHTLPYRRMKAAPHMSAAPQLLPPDPQAMLMMQQQTRRGGWLPRPNILVVLIICGFAAEAVAPDEAKPSMVAGNAASNFYSQIMAASNQKTIDLHVQEPYANALGNREAMKSNVDGICAASFILDPQLAMYCQAMADAYFNKALPPARQYHRQYQDSLR